MSCLPDRLRVVTAIIIEYTLNYIHREEVFYMFEITKLRTEYKENPIGIDVTNPRISWQLLADTRDCMQSAYQIQVSEEAQFNQIVWDSGKVVSEQSIH